MGPVGQTASATGYAGAVVIVVLFVLAQAAHVTVPDQVSAALVMILTPIVHVIGLRIGATQPDEPLPPVPAPASSPVVPPAKLT